VTTAFVLSGGASLGSIQVGMAAALEEEGIRPDLIIGTSVGAINGAWLAGGLQAERLASIWRGLRRSDLFPLRPLVGLRGFVGRHGHFVPSTGLRRLLEQHLPFSQLEEMLVPLSVVATDARSGEEVVLTEGPAVESIMASAALPGIFPSVELNGRTLIDGGIVNNTPITRAIDAGASEVWVLSTGYSCGLAQPPTAALPMALHAVNLLVQQRLIVETSTRQYPVPVHLIPPPCPITVAPTDFTQTADLIDRAKRGTQQWLGNGCPHAMPLIVPHSHSHPHPQPDPGLG
jgi:NTE family protein